MTIHVERHLCYVRRIAVSRGGNAAYVVADNASGGERTRRDRDWRRRRDACNRATTTATRSAGDSYSIGTSRT